MNLRESFSSIAFSALLLSGLAPAATAVTLPSTEKISGVIVQYAQGVTPLAPNGEPTGANLLRGRVDSEDLGGGLFVLTFSEPANKEVAKTWIKRMVLDRRIVWAEPNFAIEQASVGANIFSQRILAQARPASGPRALAAKPALATGSSDKARIRLSWRAPASRFGAKIIGYRVQYSSDKGDRYQTLIENTGNSKTKVFVSDGIRAGVSYRFRVRAITNDGSELNTIGAISNTASASVRTAPKPIFVTSAPRVGPGNVTYLAQSISDRGGFPANQVRYRAVATAADIDSVETSLCSATRCRFPELMPEITYTVEVFATNEVGSSSSNSSVAVNDPFFSVQWYLNGRNGVSMPSAWKYTQGDGYQVVAVIDTGIKAHEQLDERLTRNSDGSIYGYDFVSEIANAGDGDGEDSNPNDEGGDSAGGNSFHGTNVAGIIAAEHDSVGTAGVAPNVKILPIRALGKNGGRISDLVKAVNWASGVKISETPRNIFPVSVINLSLGAKDLVPCTDGYASIFSAAISKGITVVVAAGNEGRDSLSFPGNCEGVISVVATQALGDRATYSNYGSGAFLSAPGGEFNIEATESPESQGGIISITVDAENLPSYRLSEGTSMAAPVVSGIVALMYSMQPNITPAKVRAILQDSARPFAPESTCALVGGCGAGIINAHSALALISKLR